MPIYRKDKKPNAIWWIDITTPSGERIRRSTKTRNKAEAQEYHDRLKAELWRLHMLGERLPMTFEEAAIQLLKMSPSDKDLTTKQNHIAYWRSCFSGRTLCSLTSEEIINNIPTHQRDENNEYIINRPLTKGTQNRYLSTLKRLFSLAFKAGRLEKIPQFDMLQEPAVRVRWITQSQAQKLVQGLHKKWMQDATTLALSTGCRAGEILSLEWEHVNFEKKLAWVIAKKAKSKRARAIPLNDEAIQVLKSRQGLNDRFVFAKDQKSKPPKMIDHEHFNKVVNDLQIKDFHFHDLRHTWASWHVQNGTPLFVLKELGGWETLEMVKKYAHLNADHLSEYSGTVTFLTPLPVQNLLGDTNHATTN